MWFFEMLPSLGRSISEATGLMDEQEAANALYVLAFLGIPLLLLLTSMFVARRRHRRGEDREGVATFSGDELVEMSANVLPEELCPYYAGGMNARAFALVALSLVRSGAVEMTPTERLEEGAWRLELRDGAVVRAGDLRGSVAGLLFPDGTGVTSPAALVLAAARKPEHVTGALRAVVDRAKGLGGQRGLSVSSGRGWGNLFFVLGLALFVLGSMLAFQTTLGLPVAVIVLLIGTLLLMSCYSNVSDERTSDAGAELLARADAHRRWILRHAADCSGGTGLPGTPESVDRALRFGLAMGVDDEVVLSLAHASCDDELMGALRPPRDGWPSPLRTFEDTWRAIDFEAQRYLDRD